MVIFTLFVPCISWCAGMPVEGGGPGVETARAVMRVDPSPRSDGGGCMADRHAEFYHGVASYQRPEGHFVSARNGFVHGDRSRMRQAEDRDLPRR